MENTALALLGLLLLLLALLGTVGGSLHVTERFVA
jgi:hypothetical protein